MIKYPSGYQKLRKDMSKAYHHSISIANSEDYESMTKSVEIALAEAYKDYNASIAENKLRPRPRLVQIEREDDWREDMNITARSQLEDALSHIQHAQKYKDFVFATTVEDKSIKRASFFESEKETYGMLGLFHDCMGDGSKIDFIWNSQTKAERYIWEEVYLQWYKNRGQRDELIITSATIY